MREKTRRSLSVLLTLCMFVMMLPSVAMPESVEADNIMSSDDSGGDEEEESAHTPPPGLETEDEGDVDEPPAEEAKEKETEEDEQTGKTDQRPVTEEQEAPDEPATTKPVDPNATKTYSIETEWLTDASLYASDSLQVDIIGRRANGQDVIGSLALTAGMGWKDSIDLPVYACAGGAEPEMYTAYELIVLSGQEGMACSVHRTGMTFIVSVTMNADTASDAADTGPMTPDEEDEGAKRGAAPLKENDLDAELDELGISTLAMRLAVELEGETLTKGMPVTITATIEGVPDGMNYMLQWRNDASGDFQDVPGETGMSVTFVADEWNVNCSWRLVLKMIMPEVEA